MSVKQPLTILVDSEMLQEVEIQELILQGHVVTELAMDYDLVLSRKAWRYDPKYVKLSVQAAKHAKKEEAKHAQIAR